jgi:hypothetical protein
VFALPKTLKACKAEALTADLKNFRAYRTLRQERINRRYHGKREKAAKTAAEEKPAAEQQQ